MKLNRIEQIAIPVHDMNRATSFYKHTLGLNYLFSTGNMTFMECSGVKIMLATPEKDDKSFLGSIIYFDVDNIHESYDELLNQNVELLSKPHVISESERSKTWMCFFKDSEGNILSLMSKEQK